MVFLNINDRSIYTWFCDFVNKVTAFVSVELCLFCFVLCLFYIVTNVQVVLSTPVIPCEAWWLSLAVVLMLSMVLMP